MNTPRFFAFMLLLALGPALFACPSFATPPPRDPAALPVCTLFRDQNVGAAVPDGEGGAIVAWLDGRDGVHWVIFTQHVRRDLTLDPAWPIDGLAPAPGSPGQGGVTMVEDGAGGAIIAWQGASPSSDVFSAITAHHLRANGTLDPRWPVGGISLAIPTGDQIEPLLVSDGKGGAIAGWLDRRSHLAFQLFAQHVRADGSLDPEWPTGGRAVPGSLGQTHLAAATDDAGGALFFWSEHVPGAQAHFLAHHVMADGTLDPRWPALGRPLSSLAGPLQYGLAVVPDGLNGAIATWEQTTNTGQHVVVQHVPADGAVDPAWSDTPRRQSCP